MVLNTNGTKSHELCYAIKRFTHKINHHPYIIKMINKYSKTPLRQFPRPQAKNAFYARKGDMRYRGNMSQSQVKWRIMQVQVLSMIVLTGL